MKLILVISLLFSFALSNDTRLIIGCFKEPNNAKNAKITIDKYIENNTEFKNFLKSNSITTKYTSIGEWNVISFEPFSDSTTLFRTYFKIKDMYPDAYKVAISSVDEQEVLASNYKEEVTATQDEMTQETATSQEAEILTYANEMKKDETSSSEKTMPTKNEQTQKQEIAEITRDTLTKTPKKSMDKKSTEVPYLYPLLIVILIVVVLIIYFTQRKPKKTLHTLKEDFEEDLS